MRSLGGVEGVRQDQDVRPKVDQSEADYYSEFYLILADYRFGFSSKPKNT